MRDYEFIKQVIKNMGRKESKKYGHALGKNSNIKSYKNIMPDEAEHFINTEIPYKNLKDQIYDILLLDKYGSVDYIDDVLPRDEGLRTFDWGDRLLHEIKEKLKTGEFDKYLDNPYIKNPKQLELFDKY